MHLRALSLAAAVAAVLIVGAQFAQASVRDSGDSPLAAISAAINADLTGSQSLDSSAATVEKSRHTENSHADRVTVTTTVSSETTTQQTDRENDPADVLANLKPVSTADVLTSSARPGWGCGDMNRDHTGPPGRPDATPPPNCTKP
jgi:hypothetical protein